MLVLLVGGCVGLPPSPPQDSAQVAATGTSSADGTAGSTTHESTGPVADGAVSSTSGLPATTSSDGTTQGIDPSTIGEPPAESTGSSSSSSSGPPGGSSSDGPAVPPTCDALFGTAPAYVLCEETEDSCTFNVLTSGNSCTIICSEFGQVCIHALDNPAGGGADACFIQGDSFCDNNGKTDTLCVCTR